MIALESNVFLLIFPNFFNARADFLHVHLRSSLHHHHYRYHYQQPHLLFYLDRVVAVVADVAVVAVVAVVGVVDVVAAAGLSVTQDDDGRPVGVGRGGLSRAIP